MIETAKITVISENDLAGSPVPHTLATGKSVVVFKLKINSVTSGFKTGNLFEYAGDIYEVMNTYLVQAAVDYLELNSLKKNVSGAEIS